MHDWSGRGIILRDRMGWCGIFLCSWFRHLVGCLGCQLVWSVGCGGQW